MLSSYHNLLIRIERAKINQIIPLSAAKPIVAIVIYAEPANKYQQLY